MSPTKIIEIETSVNNKTKVLTGHRKTLRPKWAAVLLTIDKNNNKGSQYHGVDTDPSSLI
jgi:hypothetical protein